jgi:ParB family chromosome partitioning protein
MIISKDLSVRAVEKLVSQAANSYRSSTKDIQQPKEYNLIAEELTSRFKTNVTVRGNTKGKGNIVIPFESEEDLKRVLKLLNR